MAPVELPIMKLCQPSSFRGAHDQGLSSALAHSHWPRYNYVSGTRAIRVLCWDFTLGFWKQKLPFVWKCVAICGHPLLPKQFTCSRRQDQNLKSDKAEKVYLDTAVPEVYPSVSLSYMNQSISLSTGACYNCVSITSSQKSPD